MAGERLRRLEVEIDSRLSAVWLALWDADLDALEDEHARKVVGDALRVAYSLGHQDAQHEAPDALTSGRAS